MAEVGSSSQSRDRGHSPRGQQLELNKLWPAGGQSDLRLPPPKCSQSQSQSRYGDHRRDDQERRDVECEKGTRTAESNSRADPHTRKVIPYKEYTAHREAERRVSTTSKSTLGEEENWDEEPPLLPCETPPGAKSMAPSQEDKWKLMVDQDPHSRSVAGDSGHGTMAATGEDEPTDSTEELIGAVGGVNESVTVEHLSDVEWRDDDPLFMFNDENVTKPKTPAAASTPVQT